MCNWQKREMWNSKSATFTVQIVRFSTEELENCENSNKNIWNVYAYISSTHPLFNVLKGYRLSNPLNLKINDYFHGGITYYGLENENCVKIGSDYNHLDDEYFTSVTDLQGAHKIKSDAESLFTYLKTYELNKMNKETIIEDIKDLFLNAYKSAIKKLEEN